MIRFIRTVSIALALIILGTAPVVSGSVFAAETDSYTAGAEAGDVSFSGSDSLGEMLSDKLGEQQEDSEYGNQILDVAVEGKRAKVAVRATTDARVILSVFDEASGNMSGSGITDVTPDDTVAEIDLKIDTMPSTFVAKAFLVDPETNIPLCKQYECNTYTAKMQAFFAKTVDDFDEDKVVNLDSDRKNNFVVYSDKTVVIDESDGHNVVAEADGNNKKYVIDNIDETVASLGEGDILSYPRGGDMLIIKVASIEINGSTATIDGGEPELREVFDYIRIDASEGANEASVDNSDLEEGITYLGEGDSSEKAPDPVGAEIDVEDKKGVELKYEIKKFGGDKCNVTGNVSFKCEASVKCYFDAILFEDDEFEISFAVDFELGLNVKLDMNLGDDDAPTLHEFGHCTIPVATGVIVELTPSIVLKGKIEVEFNGSYTAKIGKQFKDGEFSDLSTKPSFTPQFKVEGELFLGLSMKPEVNILAKTATADAEITTGIVLSGKTQFGGDDGESEDETHECKVCIEGDLSWKIELSFETSLFNRKKLTWKADMINTKIKLKDWYYSYTTDTFDLTSCPNHRYRQTIRLLDENLLPIAGASVNKETTDEEGQVMIFFTKGENKITIKNGDYSRAFTLDVTKADEKTYILSGDGLREQYGSVISTFEPDNTVSGYCGDNVTFQYDGKGFLVISGSGETYGYEFSEYAPWYDIRDEITSINIRDGVTKIGYGAFSGFPNLKSVSIAESVTEIGDGAFGSCSKLPSISLPLRAKTIGENAFSDCGSLKKVVMFGALTTIGSGAFSYCDSLESIEIPDSVTEFGGGVFRSCPHLKNVKIGDNVVKLDDTFYDCENLETVKLGKSVGNIIYETFKNCGKLKSIEVAAGNESFCSVNGSLYSRDKTELVRYASARPDAYFRIPDGVEIIKANAFAGSRNLTYVLFPDSVREIEYYAFRECENLTNAVLGKNIRYIRRRAFEDCKSLTSITIPKGIESIEQGAFSGCDDLAGISLPDNPIQMNADAFSGSAYCRNEDNWENGVLYIGKHLMETDRNLSGEYEIKAGTLSIAGYAFYGNRELTRVIIPDTVKTIERCTFENCDKLVSAVIPDGVTSIGEAAFANCKSLAVVNLPDSVTSIEKGAYRDTAYYDNKSNRQNGALYIGKHLIAAENCPSGKCTVKSGTLTIANEAFTFENAPTSVYLPESVRLVNEMAFYSNGNPLEIEIAAGNPNYATVNGTIYNRDKTVLLHYNPSNTATEFVVPSGVETIGRCAFFNASHLTGITILGDVSVIRSGAFSNCPNLKYLTLGTSLKRIGNFLFVNSYDLPSEVYYQGSAADWKKIKLVDETERDFNYALNGATIYYNSTRVIVNSYSPAAVTEQTKAAKKPAAAPVGASVFEDTFSRTGLIPGSEALLMIVAGREGEFEISDTSLLYIEQTTVGNDGAASFENKGGFLDRDIVVLIFGKCAHEHVSRTSGANRDFMICDDCGEVVGESAAPVGDVNLDGSITISDVTEIQKYLAEMIRLSAEQSLAADADGDGKVDIGDATHLQKYLAEYDVVLGRQTA